MALKPYQYQLGSSIFGRGTEIPVSNVEIQPYNVNAQDFQISRTDENRFGIDTLAPAPIIFTMAVMENYPLEPVAQFGTIIDSLINRGSLLSSLAHGWKSTDTRRVWGATVPLLFCDADGTVLRIYGRPGKFMYKPRVSNRNLWIDIQAEFRRGDTFAHSDIEYYVGSPDDPTGATGLPPGHAPVLAARGYGDAPAWVRILFTGPMTHPVVQYGANTIELDVTIPAGKSLEINTYPWSRRVVDSDGINWRAKVIGDTKYLDQINFPAGENINISWTCGGADTTTGLYFMWREAHNVI